MYTETKIWKKTLASNDDQFDHHREQLASIFKKFRDRVGQLIKTIPAEVPGLTVHDLTHLDALWEMADILTDGDYELNPAEAFVLGGSILLHDAAMTVFAYEGGAEELKKTNEYSDAITYFYSMEDNLSSSEKENLKFSSEQYALSETLRIKHAEKAEELALQEWSVPLSEIKMYLIENTELREHFGHSIGLIAHSHHWDISQIPKLLSKAKGAFTSFPPEWKVNEVKIALILRCIDAMHIDDRRAPSFVSSIRSIGESSMQHWKFQNKLGQPHLDNGKLVYTSKTPFTIEESNAWNLCFDTLQMIDKELRETNDLQQQMGLPLFKATGVTGAGSAGILSKYIQVEGWKPLPMNLKVSNVPALAKTLGGKDLYNNPLSPLREMIQNSADAIEAREIIEDDFTLDDGEIIIKISKNETKTILDIQDNGVGMSENVLTTALLDFGLSFWKSESARNEFPGLQKHTERFRGRYGIGFFSIFMWSSEITVSSRRYNDGLHEAKTLEFRQGMESRPILRPSLADETSTKWTTRIRMAIESSFLDNLIPKDDKYKRKSTLNYLKPFVNENWLHRIRLLCGALPIKVILDNDNCKENVSLPFWRECTNKEFLEFFADVIFDREDNIERFIDTLSLLSEPAPQGGRCFISPYDSYGSRVAVYEKGIFINFESLSNINGIVESNTINAARDQHAKLSFCDDKKWINQVREKTFEKCNHLGEKIKTQALFTQLEEPDSNQPLFILNREIISISELKAHIKIVGIFSVRLVQKNGRSFLWKPAESISIMIGLTIDENRVYPLVNFEGEAVADSDISHLIETNDEPLFRLLKSIRDLLGPTAIVTSNYFEEKSYKDDYIDIVIQREP